MYIGKRVRILRKENNMKLQDLAKVSGIQIATLSRIEHNKMTGTLESHLAIAKALKVELSTLYTDITKKSNRIEIDQGENEHDVFIHNEKASHELLTSNIMKKKMMPSLLKIDSKGQTAIESLKPETERFVYLLNNSIDVIIGKNTYRLKQGHSMYFDASQEHYFQNTSNNETKILIMTTPAQF